MPSGAFSANLLCDLGKSLNLSGLGFLICKMRKLDATILSFLSVQTSLFYNLQVLM